MQDWQLVVASVLGGGGIIGTVVKLVDLKRAADNDELERENTAIGRWQSITRRAERSEAKAWRIVAWYRTHYYEARDRLSAEDRKDLPAGPPAELETLDASIDTEE